MMSHTGLPLFRHDKIPDFSWPKFWYSLPKMHGNTHKFCPWLFSRFWQEGGAVMIKSILFHRVLHIHDGGGGVLYQIKDFFKWLFIQMGHYFNSNTPKSP